MKNASKMRSGQVMLSNISQALADAVLVAFVREPCHTLTRHSCAKKTCQSWCMCSVEQQNNSQMRRWASMSHICYTRTSQAKQSTLLPRYACAVKGCCVKGLVDGALVARHASMQGYKGTPYLPMQGTVKSRDSVTRFEPAAITRLTISF